MSINWGDFDKNIDGIIAESADQTDAKLASKISSVTRMTDDEVKELFPDPADVKTLVELMKIVKSSDERNVKVNKIVTNAENFGGIVLSLLNKFA